MSKEIVGYAAGAVFGNTLIKHVYHRNILWKPEPSFTISKALYDQKRQFINTIVFKVIDRCEEYRIDASLFDIHKVAYNYGNGDNYRIAIKDFGQRGKQKELGI